MQKNERENVQTAKNEKFAAVTQEQASVLTLDLWVHNEKFTAPMSGFILIIVYSNNHCNYLKDWMASYCLLFSFSGRHSHSASRLICVVDVRKIAHHKVQQYLESRSHIQSLENQTIADIFSMHVNFFLRFLSLFITHHWIYLTMGFFPPFSLLFIFFAYFFSSSDSFFVVSFVQRIRMLNISMFRRSPSQRLPISYSPVVVWNYTCYITIDSANLIW